MIYNGSRPEYQEIKENQYNKHLLILAEVRIFRPEYLCFVSLHESNLCTKQNFKEGTMF